MIRAVAVLILAAAAGLLFSRRAAAALLPAAAVDFSGGGAVFYPPGTVAVDPPEVLNLAPVTEWIPDIEFFSGEAKMVDEAQAQKNIAAFLLMIRRAEHGPLHGADDYRRMFGGALFDSFADHPRKLVTATFGNGQRVTSDAAGAYQFLSTTWDDAKRATGVPDFTPASQDIAALWLIRRRGALADVRAGNFDEAVRKCAREWASLPGSPYGQPVISEAQARQFYASAGGVFA